MLASQMSRYQKMAVMSYYSCSHHAVYKNNLIAVLLYSSFFFLKKRKGHWYSQTNYLLISVAVYPTYFFFFSNFQFCYFYFQTKVGFGNQPSSNNMNSILITALTNSLTHLKFDYFQIRKIWLEDIFLSFTRSGQLLFASLLC